MKIVVIDGMGGGLGKTIVEHIKASIPDGEIIAVGSNALATANMLKAGASAGATGENAVICNCRSADFIVGAIGIILPDAMLGEISPKMVTAVTESVAQKILVPVPNCNVFIAGVVSAPLTQSISNISRIILQNNK